MTFALEHSAHRAPRHSVERLVRPHVPPPSLFDFVIDRS